MYKKYKTIKIDIHIFVMKTLFSINDEFDIYQDNRKSTLFTITNNNNINTSSNHSSNPLFDSIIKTKLITNSTVLTQNNIQKSISFKAFNVESFNHFKERHTKTNGSNNLPHEIILNIIYSLSKQILYLLKNESKCFYRMDVSNILVIDDCNFIYLSHQDLKDVKGKNICIYTPISKNKGYLSPELKISKTIPILVSYKTIFYSLGSLIIDNVDNIDDLSCMKDTKLYYFLKRCLYEDPDKRFLLYV